jgi:hypothetical protein
MGKHIYVIIFSDIERFKSLYGYYAENEDKMKLLIIQTLEAEDSEVRDIDIDLRTNEVFCEFRDNSKEEWETLNLVFAILKPVKK